MREWATTSAHDLRSKQKAENVTSSSERRARTKDEKILNQRRREELELVAWRQSVNPADENVDRSTFAHRGGTSMREWATPCGRARTTCGRSTRLCGEGNDTERKPATLPRTTVGT